MRIKTVFGVVVASAWLATGVAAAQNARAELRTPDGRTVGEARLEQEGNDVRLVATFNGLSPGTRAFHIHEVGTCEPPFESAGGHFNPTGKHHGKDNAQGPHAGDLPNIQVSANGPVKVESIVRGVSLDGGKNGLLDADGSALVVHEGADDDRSDPAGNAGPRIACGVVQR
jgi:Cu-Zn family superoxide dismutase